MVTVLWKLHRWFLVYMADISAKKNRYMKIVDIFAKRNRYMKIADISDEYIIL